MRFEVISKFHIFQYIFSNGFLDFFRFSAHSKLQQI